MLVLRVMPLFPIQGINVLLQVLGIMGALDPHIHKRNQHSLPGSHGEVTNAASEVGQHIVSMEELPTELWPSFTASEDYYSTVKVYVVFIHYFLFSSLC